MTCIGIVSKGTVILPPEIHLPEGTELVVTIPEPGARDEALPPSLDELFRPVAGQAVGLPRDMAKNHDHYLHGTPKRAKS